jgi:hypothetical protein
MIVVSKNNDDDDDDDGTGSWSFLFRHIQNVKRAHAVIFW